MLYPLFQDGKVLIPNLAALIPFVSLSWIGVTLKTNDPLDHSSPLESFWTSKILLS